MCNVRYQHLKFMIISHNIILYKLRRAEIKVKIHTKIKLLLFAVFNIFTMHLSRHYPQDFVCHTHP